MDTPKINVVYVAGTGRSGSTLLGNLLGEVPGFFSAGEISQLFGRGMVENWYCGCGVRFDSCTVWQSVLSDAYGPAGVIPEEMIASLRCFTRVRQIPTLLASRTRPEKLENRGQAYLDKLDSLYRALGSTLGGQVLVDSSKSPSYAFLLGLLPSVNLHIVHLVRDPRGTAFSWRRKRVRTDGAQARDMQTMSLTKSSALWSIWNLTAEALWSKSKVPYQRIRYEDLIANPVAAMSRILDLVGSPEVDLSFLDDGSVTFDRHHTISGNPMRLQTGEVKLAPDLEWLHAMPLRHRMLVTAITSHSLLRYGYRFGRSQQLSLSRRS